MSADDATMRERLADTLNGATRYGENPPPRSRHDEHSYDGGCYVCCGDVAKLIDTLIPVVSSWAWLMAILAEHYPADVFAGGAEADPGPRIVALVREVDRLRQKVNRTVEWADRLAAEIAPPEVLSRYPETISRWSAAVDYAHRKQGAPEERAPVKPDRMRAYLAETLGLTPEQAGVTSDADLLRDVAIWVQLGKQATLARRDSVVDGGGDG